MDLFERSQTIDPEVRAYVYSLVSAVGGQDTLEERYAVGDDALAVLNDLLRWLKLFDGKTNRYDVKRCMAEANLVKGDLLEILALWPEEAQENKSKAKLAFACIQLLALLTWPLELKKEMTTHNHLRHRPYIQLAQVGYKRAVLHFEGAPILRTAVRIGLPSMAVPKRERKKRDDDVIVIMLTFFRNLATITQPQQLPSQGDENEISRSATIETFSEQEVLNLLLTIASGAQDEFPEQDAIVLDTLFHLLKGIDPRRLFMKEDQVATEETNELKDLMLKEKAMRNSYNKHAPTRHGRFGTMLWVKRDDSKMSTVSGQHSITNEKQMLQSMDVSKKWDKPKYKGKLVHEFNETRDFGMRIELTEKARSCLRRCVEDFLDSSFNPLFASLRKAIEREAKRLQDMHTRQYFYLISWFLSAEAARRDQIRAKNSWHADRPSQISPEENTFAYVAAVLDQETFVLLSRQIQKAHDDKEWQNLQAALLCFTQILLTVQNMADSESEEDQEIAENIQNRIFYEESTHDLLMQILRGYSNQGFAYLDAVTECAHVFVRMLERYAKQNVDLQIRSKRRARKKQKKTQQDPNGQSNDAEGNEDAADAELDQQEAFRAVSERKFDFARLTAKFLNQGTVNTFLSLLHFYNDLSPAQLKRCHRFFYRLAFKNDLAVLLFRVDILALFQKIIKGSDSLRQDMEGYREWEELIRQVFRRCIKWIEREPADGVDKTAWREAAIVEMLFSKIPGTMFFLHNGYDLVVEKRAPRPPAEMEVKGSVGEEQRVGVATSVLLEQGKQHAVEWVKKQLKDAAEERQAWRDAGHARAANGDEEMTGNNDEAAGAPTIFISADTDERKGALFKDKFLRLFLTILGLQRLGTADDTDAPWIVPSEMTAEQLNDALAKISKAEHDGPELEEGKAAMDCIRNKSSAQRVTAAESDSESEREIENPLFPPNRREKRKEIDGEEEAPKKKRRLTKRNTKELTVEELKEKAKAKRKREREKNAKIKSKDIITELDDETDEEADAEFFRLEEQRRKKTAGIIRSALIREADKIDGEDAPAGKKKKKSKEAKAAREIDGILSKTGSDEDAPNLSDSTHDSSDNGPIRLSSEPDRSDDSDVEVQRDALARKTLFEENDGDSDHEDIEEVSKPSTVLPLGEVSANLRQPIALGDDEDDEPIVKSAVTARRRPNFIIEDDSDDD